MIENWHFALFARFLIGAGSAAGFIGTFKVISLWFPSKTYPMMIGFTTTIALLGASFGGTPMNYFVTQYGWENAGLFLAAAGVILSVFIALFIASYKSSNISFFSNSFLKGNFSFFIPSPVLILISIGGLLMVGPLEGFADVWGTSYLMKVYSLGRTDAAFVSSLIFTGMIIGGPLLGYVCDKARSIEKVIAFCGISMAALFSIVLFSNGSLSYLYLSFIMLTIGVLSSYQVLVFALGASLVSTEKENITVSFLNCINMLGGIVFHTTIGLFMDFYWNGTLVSNQRIYEAYSYQHALWVIPVAAFFGGFMFLFLGALRRRPSPVF